MTRTAMPSATTPAPAYVHPTLPYGISASGIGVLSHTPAAPPLLMLTAAGPQAYDLKRQCGKVLLYFLVQEACYK